MSLSNIDTVTSVSEWCLESYPCQHCITFIDMDGNTQKTRLFGTDILRLIRNAKWKNPDYNLGHFQAYEKMLNDN